MWGLRNFVRWTPGQVCDCQLHLFHSFGPGDSRKGSIWVYLDELRTGISSNVDVPKNGYHMVEDDSVFFFFPTSLWGFCFLACIPPVSRPPRLPVRRASVINSFHTQLVSHTTHLTHNSSHTQTSKNLSHTTHLTQLILHTTHLTHNSSHKSSHLTHNSSHTTHLTQLISHTTHLTHNSSHTTHLTQRISHNSSHSTNSYHSSHTSGRGYLLRGRCSTQSLLKELRRGLSPAGPRLLFAWQTQYTEPPEGAAARIVAGWAAAPLCVADAVHRAS